MSFDCETCEDVDFARAWCPPPSHDTSCIHWTCRPRPNWNPFVEFEMHRMEGGRRELREPQILVDGDPRPGPPIPVHDSVYELTLTSVDDDVYYLRTVFHKIVASAQFDVVFWKACVELTKSGLPHIHAILYSTRKYLDASKIKKMFKYRYELKRVRDEVAFNNYILKEDGNPIISNYCEKKGIPQIWQLHFQDEFVLNQRELLPVA